MHDSILLTVETIPAEVGFSTWVGYMATDDPSRGNCFSFSIKGDRIRNHKCINMRAEHFRKACTEFDIEEVKVLSIEMHDVVYCYVIDERIPVERTTEQLCDTCVSFMHEDAIRYALNVYRQRKDSM